MTWQKTAALGCVYILFLWMIGSGRLASLLENCLPLSVLERISAFKSDVICSIEDSECLLYATLSALPDDARVDPVVTVRAISDQDLVSGTARVASAQGSDTPELELSFRPPAPGRYRIYARLEYASREAALADPDPRLSSATNPQYIGVDLGSTPVHVLVTPGPEAAKQPRQSCDVAVAGDGGYWRVMSGSAWRQFTISPKCGGAKALWYGHGCSYPAVTPKSVRKALASWQLFMIGDSVTRQMGDSLAEAFSNSVPRFAKGSKEEADWRALVPVHEKDRNPWISGLRAVLNEPYPLSNPRKIEVPKLYNATQMAMLKHVLRTHRFDSQRSVAIVNFGLHDAAYGSLSQYSQLLEEALLAVKKTGFKHIIWRMTSAIHPVALDDQAILPQHRHFTIARVEVVNRLAKAVVDRLNEEQGGPKIHILDAYAMTRGREDGVRPGDMRHYCPDVMLNIWAVLFSMLPSVRD